VRAARPAVAVRNYGYRPTYRGRYRRHSYRPTRVRRAPATSPLYAAQMARAQRLAADLLAIGPNAAPGGPESKALARDLASDVAPPLRLNPTRAATLADDLVAALASRRGPALNAGEVAGDLMSLVNSPQLYPDQAEATLQDAEIALTSSGVPRARVQAVARDIRGLWRD
jgi:hypothetical protein